MFWITANLVKLRKQQNPPTISLRNQILLSIFVIVNLISILTYAHGSPKKLLLFKRSYAKEKLAPSYFFNFFRYPDLQKSKEIFLEVGKKYYLEGIMVGGGGSNHIEIGVYLPDGSNIIPITSHYLSADVN